MASASAPDQERRRERLQALLNHPDFGGVRAEVARLIGLTSGAYIRQLLAAERPITEKLISKIESAQGGKYRGWFSAEAPAVQPTPAPQIDGTPAYLAELAAKLPPDQQERLVAVAEVLAGPRGDQVRISFSLVERVETPNPVRPVHR